MTDIQIDGDVSGANVNVGGTQHIQNLIVNHYHNVLPDKPKQISVFLSYARADDDPDYDDPAKSFMRRLYNALTAAGFAVWWDRVSMPSRGEAFTKEIETAIRACQRFVLVVGPGAIASSYVRAEWEFAFAQCKPVTPILRAGEFDSIPPAVVEINMIDCRPSREEAAAFGDLINRLNEDAPLGDPIGVKALPKGYVTRHEPFNTARDALRADAINPTVISAPPGGVALYGLGGIGKSTMAVALAHDCQVRRHYRDGVLWLEVGQTPSPLTLQAAVGVMLGDSRENYQDETSAALSLSTTLHKKAALIVLDDVWDHKLVEKFPISGTACRLLITTRSRKLAEYVDGVDIRLNLLSEAEGARLIAGIIGGDEDNPRYKQITCELGGHTLAITLAAAQIQSRYAKDADDLLGLLRKRATEPDPFRDLSIEETDKDRNLALSLSLSYDSLPNDDLRRRFRQVGIFVLESTFDREALAAIWGDADEDDARAPLQILVGAGLLDVEEDGRYSQHRLLHVYARALMRMHEELGETFNRYADYVIIQAGQFDTLALEEWIQLDPLLPHMQAVGDELVVRYAATDTPDEALQKRMRDFAYDVTRYVLDRPQAITNAEGKYLRGMTWIEGGLSVSQTQGDQHREAFFLNELASMWSALGETRKALQLLERALPLYRAVEDQGGEAITLNNIGRALGDLGDQYKALAFFEQALPLFRVTGNRQAEAIMLNNIGMAWSELGEKRKALDYYKQALPLRQAVGDRRGEAATLNNIGMVWDDLDEQHEALAFYDRALSLIRFIGDRRGEATTLHNIGIVWSKLGDKCKALEYFELALPLRRDVGDGAGEALTCYSVGMVHLALGDLDKAIEYVEHCVTLDEQIELPVLERDRQTLTQLKDLRDGTTTEHQLPATQAAEVMRQLAQLYAQNGDDAVRDALKGEAQDEVIEQIIVQLSRQRTSQSTQSTLPADAVRTLAGNTVTVMTDASGQRDEWRDLLRSQRDEWSTQGESWQIEVEFADALLAILDGEKPVLPDENPYAGVIVQVIEVIDNHRNAS